MPFPRATVSMVAPLMVRTDLPRENILDYWRTGHADVVCRLRDVIEYNQLVFSSDDHGF